MILLCIIFYSNKIKLKNPYFWLKVKLGFYEHFENLMVCSLILKEFIEEFIKCNCFSRVYNNLKESHSCIINSLDFFISYKDFKDAKHSLNCAYSLNEL